MLLLAGKNKIRDVKVRIRHLEGDLDRSKQELFQIISDSDGASMQLRARQRLYRTLDEREDECTTLELTVKSSVESAMRGFVTCTGLSTPNATREMNDLMMDLSMVDSPSRQP